MRWIPREPGDLFASGFLYGLAKGLRLEDCCKVGCCSGGAVVRSLGGEVTEDSWEWMYKRMQTHSFPASSSPPTTENLGSPSSFASLTSIQYIHILLALTLGAFRCKGVRRQ